MPIAQVAYLWSADVEIEVFTKMAFSPQTKDEGRGATKKRVFIADWLRDGQVYFSPSKRLKGWLKTQLALVRSSYAGQANAIKIFPADGEDEYIPIAKVEELVGGTTPLRDQNYDLPKGLKDPKWSSLVVPKESGIGSRSTTTYWYELPGPRRMKVKMVSFARSIEPEKVKEAMDKLGAVVGVGDKFSQGFGRFKLIHFESKKDKLAL